MEKKMPLTKQMANHFTLVLKLSEEASRTWEGGGDQSTRWGHHTPRSFSPSPGPVSLQPSVVSVTVHTAVSFNVRTPWLGSTTVVWDPWP